jgi:hypothetical protein
LRRSEKRRAIVNNNKNTMEKLSRRRGGLRRATRQLFEIVEQKMSAPEMPQRSRNNAPKRK